MADLCTVTMQDGVAWRAFHHPVEIVTAYSYNDVIPALESVQRAVECDELAAAGFVSYEAGPAFDEAVSAYSPDDFPLVWFGLFEASEACALIPGHDISPPIDWTPSISRAEYDEAFREIKNYIAGGDTYQVNYTFRLAAVPPEDTLSWFNAIAGNGHSRYGAYIDTGDGLIICSFSPELFFECNGRTIRCRPMKGTAPRGLTLADDRAYGEWLASSEKNRAENLMIVDMIRNDLGRIATTGSVHVPSLWDIERYPGVWQMTSVVEAETEAGFSDIFRALFPCASITGAPKSRTAAIIREIESTSRHLYTGSAGFYLPDGRMSFNVAIRTAVFDMNRQTAEYGVGGGIVWDSTPGDEYDECIVKAGTVTVPERPFSLLETMIWTEDDGVFLLERHIQRLCDTAEYYGYPVVVNDVISLIDERVRSAGYHRCRLRLTVDRDGGFTCDLVPYSEDENGGVVKLAIDSVAVDTDDSFLYHKTTRREVYECARARHPKADDVLMINPEGDITEATIANVVCDIRGCLVTPPVASGLLGGTFRAELIERGEITERRVSIREVQRCRAVYLINSVRKWRRAKIVM